MFKNISIFIIFFVCIYSSVIYAEEVNPIGSADVQPAIEVVDAPAFCGKEYVQEKSSLNNNDWIPLAVDYDWVKLSSDEWLKGKIKSMYHKNLEFDSDKLKLLNIKWKDVKILRSYRYDSIDIEEHGNVHGVLEITDQTMQVINDYETLTFDRSRLISFVPGGEKESDFWVFNVTFGLDLKEGNTNQFDYNAKLNIKRRASKLRFELNYIGFISTTNGVNDQLTETVNNHRVTANISYFKTHQFFYSPVLAELFSDPFLNINLRTAIGTGVGYTVIDRGETELVFLGGPAYVHTNFISVTPGEKNSRSTAAIVLQSYFKTDFTSEIDFITRYNIQYTDEASGGYSHHAIATFTEEIKGELDFDVSFIWDRISSPARESNGDVPESDDFRLTVGLSYTY